LAPNFLPPHHDFEQCSAIVKVCLKVFDFDLVSWYGTEGDYYVNLSVDSMVSLVMYAARRKVQGLLAVALGKSISSGKERLERRS
jgi:hypothetical protein